VRLPSSAAFEATLSPLKVKPKRHAALPQAASREREAGDNDDDDDDDDDGDTDDDDDDDEPGPFCADFEIRKEQAAYSTIPFPPRFKIFDELRDCQRKNTIFHQAGISTLKKPDGLSSLSFQSEALGSLG
jgi:hypothetical protein